MLHIEWHLHKLVLTDFTLRLYRVLSRSGILGSEIADKATSSKEVSGSVRHVKHTITYVKKTFHRTVQTLYKHSHWQNEGPQTSLYNWIPSIFQLPTWFPQKKKMLTHLLTGHGHFQYCLKHFNVIASYTCTCGVFCMDEHYFITCPRKRHVIASLHLPLTTVSFTLPKTISQQKTMHPPLAAHFTDEQFCSHGNSTRTQSLTRCVSAPLTIPLL